ncbi:MAG: OB-fold domain-containing protein [Deltaproteobacteria bacterium]|nr:OB-fold domain-containing protein [Deltaproteobacteria bacterium]
MTTSNSIPVIKGLFAETSEGPRLLGCRCATCGTLYFPKAANCQNPDCGDSKLEDASFGPHGKLYSCAVQNFPPPPPAKYDEPFAPYAVGLVDLAEGLRILGRISTDDVNGLKIGSEMELVLEPLCREDDGSEIITWKFRPI